jgi:LPS sulfotransferase NodH
VLSQDPNRFHNPARRRRIAAFVTAYFPEDTQQSAYELLHGQSMRLDADLQVFYSEPADPRTTSAEAKAWLDRGFPAVFAPHQQRADLAHFRSVAPALVDAVLREIAELVHESVDAVLARHEVAQAFTFARWVKAWAPDVVYSCYAYGGTLAAHIVKRLLDLPHVLFLFHLHEGAQDPWVSRLLTHYARHADAVLIGAPAHAEQFASRSGPAVADRILCIDATPGWEDEAAGRAAAAMARHKPAHERHDLGPRASFVTTHGAATEQPVVTPFLVAGPERTGSNLVLDMLAAHPQVLAAGELFNTRMIDEGRLDTHCPPGVDPRELIELRTRDPAACLRRIGQGAAHAGAKAFGFKLLYFHAMAENRIVDHLVGLRNLRVLHLTRQDALARWVSQVKAAQQDVWFAPTDQAKPKKSGPVTLDPLETLLRLEATEVETERFRATFAGCTALEMTYEQFAANIGQGMATIQDFLGVDRVELQPQSFKTGSSDVRREIANWDELAAAFAGTRWRRCFELP